MRKRDVGVLVLCCLGLLVSFQHEGALSIRRGFVVPIVDDSSKDRLLPSPVVTDLDGDGKNEVLLLTTRETLSLINPALIRRSHFEFTELHAKEEAHFMANCIGFGAGYLQKYNASTVKDRKQVVVAVLDDYTVLGYNHRLELLWHERLPDQDGGLFTPSHASVLVLSHDVHREDAGMVVIGVDTRSAEDRDGRRALGQLHFSYFALNGGDGAMRWKHDASSFHDPDATKTYPQHSYKLSAQHLEHHSGEQDWTVYRRSMMAVFPHAHRHIHDTQLRIHHFSKKLSAKELEERKKKRKAPTSSHKPGKPLAGGGDDNYGELGDRLAGFAGLLQEKLQAPHSHEEHIHHPNVIVAHLAEGIEVLHLYTGRTLCQFGPLQPGHVYDDVNGDTAIDSIHTTVQRPRLTHRSRSEHVQDVTPICAGTVDSGTLGMARENLWNGTICMRGGVLRHFEVLKALLRQGEHQVDEEEEAPDFLQDWGSRDHFDETTKAAPPLVLHHRVHEVKGLRRIRSTVVFYINSGLLTCVDPSTKRILWQTETDSTFSSHEEGLGANENLEDADGLSLRGAVVHDQTHLRHFPHLVPFSVPASHSTLPASKVGSVRSVATTKDKPYILVVGDNVLTAVRSDNGKVEEEVDLDETVIAPLVLGDFNSDGTRDIIAVSHNAYYGFITYQQGGTSVLTFLMLSVIGLLALLFISHRYLALADPYFEPSFNPKRSTD
eukprot:GGOE01001290.1.p1 GENE.GGOE01001290.1~~GGOE01001290.1.p1  ORF type:complete len:718 (-),score=247.69 GGOE01001290.1:86-2239(-)